MAGGTGFGEDSEESNAVTLKEMSRICFKRLVGTIKKKKRAVRQNKVVNQLIRMNLVDRGKKLPRHFLFVFNGAIEHVCQGGFCKAINDLIHVTIDGFLKSFVHIG